jgi:molecular chaperone DnaK
MTRDADAHAEEDRKAREAVETRNRAEQTSYAAEKMLQESGDKIGPAEKAAVESAIEEVKKALEANDPAQISKALDSLNAAQSKAAEALYKNAAASAAGPSGPTGGAGGESSGAGASKPTDDVIDAEVVEEEK